MSPLGDSARMHLESSSFRAPGDLLERLGRIRGQLDQEGRLLEPLPDAVEDSMEGGGNHVSINASVISDL